MKLRTRNGSVPAGEPARDGYVIFAVLIVIVVLALVGYRFAESMSSEYRAAVRTADEAQVKAAALSGLNYVAGALADPNTLTNTLGGNPFDNPTAFSEIEVVAASGTTIDRKRIFFSVVAAGIAPGSSPSTYTQQYGVIDEGGKINLNALIALDPTGTLLYNVLTQLFAQPIYANNGTIAGIAPNLIASIANWMMPTTSTPFPNGADSSYYQSLPNPYQAKNGPLNSLDELLLVQYMDYTLLYGGDMNRNGIMDGNEQDNTPGLANFITVYGRELNMSSAGTARIYLNGQLSTIYPELQTALGTELADYIIASKLLTTSPAPTTPLPASSVASASQLDTAVQTLLQEAATLGQNGQRIRSVSSLIGTQVTLPKPAGAAANTPSLIYQSPLQTSNQTQLAQMLSLVMDQCTVQDAIELVPRINVNTAPVEVLMSICKASSSATSGTTTSGTTTSSTTTSGTTTSSSTAPTSTPLLTEAQADAILTQRITQLQTPGLLDPSTLSLSWLLTTNAGSTSSSAILTPTQFQQMEKYITGTSMVYRVQVIGYFNISQEGTGTAIGSGSMTGYTTGNGSTSGSGALNTPGPSNSSYGYGGGPVARMEAVIDTNQGSPRFLFLRDLSDIDNPPGFIPGQPLQQVTGTQSGSGSGSGSGTTSQSTTSP